METYEELFNSLLYEDLMDNFCEIAILLEMLTNCPQNIYPQIVVVFVLVCLLVLVVFFFLISTILKAKFPSSLLGLRNVVWLSDKRMVENKQVEVLKGMMKSGIILHSLLSMVSEVGQGKSNLCS